MAVLSALSFESAERELSHVPFRSVFRPYSTTARNGERPERAVFRSRIAQNGAHHGSKNDAFLCCFNEERNRENRRFSLRRCRPVLRGTEFGTGWSARDGARHGMVFHGLYHIRFLLNRTWNKRGFASSSFMTLSTNFACERRHVRCFPSSSHAFQEQTHVLSR